MNDNKKISIIRFNAIGDVVLSTIIPFAIKLKYPNCQIHYLTSQGNVKMLKNCPYIDKVIGFKGNIYETIKNQFKQKYDVIISLNYTLKCYALAFLSFPKKVVFKSFKGTSWVENYFYTAKKVYSDLKLPDRLFLMNRDEKIYHQISKQMNSYPKPHIIINPGKYFNQPRQGRVWNIQKWKDLSKRLLNTYGGTVFVNGSLDERDYHMSLIDKNIIICSGLFELEETCAFLSLADLVVSGDSGPLHIASAYNRKTLAILGSTSPNKIKPYGKNGYFIEPSAKCRYCWKKKCRQSKYSGKYCPCIESISVDMVMEKIEKHTLLTQELETVKC